MEAILEQIIASPKFGIYLHELQSTFELVSVGQDPEPALRVGMLKGVAGGRREVKRGID